MKVFIKGLLHYVLVSHEDLAYGHLSVFKVYLINSTLA